MRRPDHAPVSSPRAPRHGMRPAQMPPHVVPRVPPARHHARTPGSACTDRCTQMVPHACWDRPRRSPATRLPFAHWMGPLASLARRVVRSSAAIARAHPAPSSWPRQAPQRDVWLAPCADSESRRSHPPLPCWPALQCRTHLLCCTRSLSITLYPPLICCAQPVVHASGACARLSGTFCHLSSRSLFGELGRSSAVILSTLNARLQQQRPFLSALPRMVTFAPPSVRPSPLCMPLIFFVFH
jgi:hypothetical protein